MSESIQAFSLAKSESKGGLIPGTLWASYNCPIFWINGGLSWAGRGKAGSCLHCSKLGPASSTSSGVFSLPQADLCWLLTSTSEGPIWVLLSQGLPSEPLDKQSCFFGVGLAMNPGNGCPTGGVPTKGMSGKRDTRGGGVPVGQTGLLEGSGASYPSGLVLWW